MSQKNIYSTIDVIIVWTPWRKRNTFSFDILIINLKFQILSLPERIVIRNGIPKQVINKCLFFLFKKKKIIFQQWFENLFYQKIHLVHISQLNRFTEQFVTEF